MNDKTQEAISKGQRAARLLDDPAFQEAVAYVNEALMTRWKVAQQVEERERIWHCVGLLQTLKGALSTAYTNGKLSKKKLDDLTMGQQAR